MKTLPFIIALFLSISLGAQTVHDFTITDSDGAEHTLYDDYLDQGKIVLLKFFFSTCPPCNSSAPAVQALYEQFGSGQDDVIFLELSTKTWDNNNNAANYKNQHGLTFPVTGNDGGAYDAALPFIQGDFGTFFGTPSYAIVLPDGTVEYPAGSLSSVETKLTEAVNNLGGGTIPSTSVGVQTLAFKNGQPINVTDLSVILKPKNASGPVVDLLALTNGTLIFDYPSADIPEMNDPVIIVSSSAEAISDEITPIDIVTIRRHILQLSTMNLPFQTMAADLNGDNKISGQDIVALNKVYLKIETSFPNGTPSYMFLPAQQDLEVNPGNAVSVSFTVLKMGDTSIN